MNKSEGMPQQQSAWDTPPESNPRMGLGGVPGLQVGGNRLLRQLAPGSVAPTVMPGGMTVVGGGNQGAPRPPIWQAMNNMRPGSARPKTKTATTNNPFARGGY